MTSPCVRCGAPTDGYACTRCGVDKPRGWLEEIADMTPAARDIAHGLSSHSGGGASGKPGSRMPLDLTATAKLDAVQGQVTTWARHAAEQRSGALWVTTGSDPIVEAARWLAGQLEWFRHRGEADEFLSDIEACARVLRGVARGPAEQKYLGPCGADVVRANIVGDQWESELIACDGDVYGRAGATYGTCRTCGAQVDQDERRTWLDEQVGGSDLAWTARGIADALDINVKTVRAWATPHLSDTGVVLREAKLRTYYRLDEHIVPWTEPEKGEDVKARGDRLHYVGDVRKLAQESADRREAERQRREAGVAS